MTAETESKPSLPNIYAKMPKPTSETEEGQERLRVYRLALGHFVETFAKAEIAMALTLRWHTKLPATIARAVFSGVRTDVASGYLRRLAEAKVIDKVEWDELLPVIEQLTKISTARNNILHYGAEAIPEGSGYVTNAIIALTEEKVTSFPMSADILDQMTYDSHKILIHLAARHMGRPQLRGKHPEMDEVLQAAWRYTPDEQRQKAKAGKRRATRKWHRQSGTRLRPPLPK